MPYASACGNPQEWWVPASRLFAARYQIVSGSGRKSDADGSSLLIFYALCRFISIRLAKYLCLFSQLNCPPKPFPRRPELLHYATFWPRSTRGCKPNDTPRHFSPRACQGAPTGWPLNHDRLSAQNRQTPAMGRIGGCTSRPGASRAPKRGQPRPAAGPLTG